jgi:hypothetical protein
MIPFTLENAKLLHSHIKQISCFLEGLAMRPVGGKKVESMNSMKVYEFHLNV